MVASNVDHRDGRCITASVHYYDSGQPFTISLKMRETICTFINVMLLSYTLTL